MPNKSDAPSTDLQLIYPFFEEFDPPVELDEAEHLLYKDGNAADRSRNFEGLNDKFLQVAINAPPPSHSAAYKQLSRQLFKAAEFHVWDAFNDLRDQHNHAPFHIRRTRRQELLEKISTSHTAIIGTEMQDESQRAMEIDCSPTVQSSSDGSSTNGSSGFSAMNRPDDTTITSHEPSQFAEDQANPPAGRLQDIDSSPVRDDNVPWREGPASESLIKQLPNYIMDVGSQMPDPLSQLRSSNDEISEDLERGNMCHGIDLSHSAGGYVSGPIQQPTGAGSTSLDHQNISAGDDDIEEMLENLSELPDHPDQEFMCDIRWLDFCKETYE